MKIRDHPRHRDPGPLLQHAQSRLQDGDVSAELIDDQSPDALPLLFFQQHDRPDELGKYTAPVDIPGQQDRCVHKLCQSHIYNIILLQIDLCRAARPLDHDHIVLPPQFLISFHDIRDIFFFMPVIFHRRHIADGPPVKDHLGAGVVGRLEQDRVHGRVRLDPGRLRLHHLGTPHLQPVPGDKGIERHILGFKGGHAVSILTEHPAESACEHTLPGIGHGPLYHDRTFHFLASFISLMADSRRAFSSRVRTAIRYHPCPSPG